MSLPHWHSKGFGKGDIVTLFMDPAIGRLGSEGFNQCSFLLQSARKMETKI